MLNDWTFKNENFISLTNQLKLEDVKSFGYLDTFSFDIVLYLRYALSGVKKYLLGDKEKNLSRNIKVYKRMQFADRIIKGLLCVVVFYYLFIKHEMLEVCKSYFNK